MTGLNCRPAACKAAALPAELIARNESSMIYFFRYAYLIVLILLARRLLCLSAFFLWKIFFFAALSIKEAKELKRSFASSFFPAFTDFKIPLAKVLIVDFCFEFLSFLLSDLLISFFDDFKFANVLPTN